MINEGLLKLGSAGCESTRHSARTWRLTTFNHGVPLGQLEHHLSAQVVPPFPWESEYRAVCSLSSKIAGSFRSAAALSLKTG